MRGVVFMVALLSITIIIFVIQYWVAASVVTSGWE